MLSMLSVVDALMGMASMMLGLITMLKTRESRSCVQGASGSQTDLQQDLAKSLSQVMIVSMANQGREGSNQTVGLVLVGAGSSHGGGDGGILALGRVGRRRKPTSMSIGDGHKVVVKASMSMPIAVGVVVAVGGAVAVALVVDEAVTVAHGGQVILSRGRHGPAAVRASQRCS